MKTTRIKYLTQLLLPAFFILCLLSACKKEEIDEWPTDTPLLKTQTIVSGGVVTSRTYFYYDTQGRLSVQIDSLFSADTTSTSRYYYTDSAVVMKFGYGPDSSTYSTTTYPLDSNGRIAGHNYDAEGHLLGFTSVVYEWADDNLQRIYSNGNLAAEFTYHIGKRNTIDLNNKGLKFYGKDSKNPLVSQLTGTITTLNYTHSYDAEGRITERVSQSGEVYQYTYM